jgi:transposase InsO family protein
LTEAVRIAEYERKIGQLTVEVDLLKKGARLARPSSDASYSIVSGPGPSVLRKDAELLKLARSTCYYRLRRATAALRAVEKRIVLLCAELPRYGYRWITALPRIEGISINHKAVARLMRERGLQVRPLRRFVCTTDSEHDSPIFPNLTRGFVATGADQLWSPTSPTSPSGPGFVYLAVIVNAWSRRVSVTRSVVTSIPGSRWPRSAPRSTHAILHQA